MRHYFMRKVENRCEMLTDRAPRRPVLRAAFSESDGTKLLNLPGDDGLKSVAEEIESSLEAETRAALRQACARFLNILGDFYGVEAPVIRILAARPIRTHEGGWATELFGDYDPKTKLIRVWMRTGVRKQVTSFGTFLSTLCHEFSDYLDYQRFKYGDSWHAWILRALRGPLPPRARYAGKALVLDQSEGWTLADRLAADKGRVIEPWRFRSAWQGEIHFVWTLGREFVEGERLDEANHATRDLHAHRNQIGGSQGGPGRKGG
jgi:hypothetical protein